MSNRTIFRTIVRYALYPMLLIIVLLIIKLTIDFGGDYKSTYGAVTVFLVVTLMLLERLFPLDTKWSMNVPNFLRDLKYIAVDAPVIGLTKAAFGWLAIYYSEQHKGIFSNANIILCVVGYLLVFEFLQYWYHRLSHRANGRLGRFLWRVHVAHHLPSRVYVVMHAVFHPVNAFLTATIIQVPLILLGVPPAAAFAATLLIDLQSLISHFNVDIRAGWLNYIFIGTETHRYHHSTDVGQTHNYGNTLAIWDIVFGTFYYRPGKAPDRLGVADPTEYPETGSLLDVIAFPFKK